MTAGDPLSAEAVYAFRGTNLKWPGTQAQATAAEAAAQSRLNDGMPTGVTFTVGAGSIKVSN